MEPLPPYSAAAEDICQKILSHYIASTEEKHKHLCSVIGAMSEELKDRSPCSYFAASLSSLEQVLSDNSPQDAQVVESLVTILSIIVPIFTPTAVLRKYSDKLSGVLFRVMDSESVTPVSAAAAVKCASFLVTVQEKASWEGCLPSLFGFLLAGATNPTPLVRKQSHTCLRDALRSFQSTPVLIPASEAFLERMLLLSGGSNSSSSESPKGRAQDVLFLLDALTDSLPLMSSKCVNAILKYFKSLLELRQPVVTKLITSCLNSVCQYPTLGVAPDVLLDLLCSLSISISANEMSGDDMSFTARLLDLGMKKVYSANPQLSAVKMPIVFNALADMFASEHEAALFAATGALKGLISVCVDESLIRQGIDHIRGSTHEIVRNSGPTIVEKICATVENLLDYRYSAVWDMSFQVTSALFGKLGTSSSYFMKGTLENLADMQKLPNEDFPYRKQLHECIGSALTILGPETFLSIIPLKLESVDLSEANDWLFPILKQYTVGASIAFFTESILPTIRSLKRRSLTLEREGKVYSSRSLAGLIDSLWSLLPSFCNYPLDTFISFKELEKELVSALHEEPDVCGIICSALQKLIQQNKKIVEGNNDLPDTIEVSIPVRQAVARYTPEVASNNLSVLRSSASDIIPVLSSLLLRPPYDSSGCLQNTISQLASIADNKFVLKFFTSKMHELLMVMQEVGKSECSESTSEMQIDNSSEGNLERVQLLDLVCALLPGLGSTKVDLLYVVIKLALKDADGLIQKKAYKGLSNILKNSDDFLSRNIKDLLNLMIDVLPSCHCSAKCHRLDCIIILIQNFICSHPDTSQSELELRWHDVVSAFLTEIILSLKEANTKARNRAQDMIVEIGHACGEKKNLHWFFSMVVGGLAGESPHMISASVTSLARLVNEFSDLVSAAYNVLPSMFLLQRKNKEVLKAILSFLKVLVVKSEAGRLEMHLRSIVGLLMWQDGTKNHFKSKVKVLLEMLIKKCGFDVVKSVMPEDHKKLLSNIRKIKLRRENRTSVISKDAGSHQSKATTSGLSKWNNTNIYSAFGDDEIDSVTDYMDGKTSGFMTAKSSSFRAKRSREASKSLPEDSYDQFEDEPLDLLDRRRARSALRSSSQHSCCRPGFDDEPEIDSEGRLIIHEEGKTRPDIDYDRKSQADSNLSMYSQRGRKRRKVSASGSWAYTGNEYASKKKASWGDVTREGKLEPYAYWPLDRKMVSRRSERRAAARKGMSSVIKMAKGLEGRKRISFKAMKPKKKIQKTFTLN